MERARLSLAPPASPRRPDADYTVSGRPAAANAVPYELYDEETTWTKLRNAQEVVASLRQRISD